jgi:hypothetical protein
MKFNLVFRALNLALVLGLAWPQASLAIVNGKPLGIHHNPSVVRILQFDPKEQDYARVFLDSWPEFKKLMAIP